MPDTYKAGRPRRSSTAQDLLDLYTRLSTSTPSYRSSTLPAMSDRQRPKRASAGPAIPSASSLSSGSQRRPVPYTLARASQSHAGLPQRDPSSSSNPNPNTNTRLADALPPRTSPDVPVDLDGEMTDQLGDLHHIPSSRPRRSAMRLSGVASDTEYASSRLDTQAHLACFYLCSGAAQVSRLAVLCR